MKAVLDACVLYPTVLREILLGVAQTGLYTPLWSERILEEWARATRKLGPGAEDIARAELAAVRRAFPRATVPPTHRLEARLHLPDENDIHVLATAIAGGADAIVLETMTDDLQYDAAALLFFEDDGSLAMRAATRSGEALDDWL